MLTSEHINELAAALAKAQAVMAGASKDRENPHFKSKYADLASVWDACREALTANGIAVVQMTMPSEAQEVVVQTRLCHASGQWIQGTLAIPVTKNDAQGFGSCLTYARRYALAAAVGVAPEDDDANAAVAAKPAAKALPGAMNGADVNRAELAAMSPDQQDYIRTEAAEVKRLHAAGMSVYDYVESRRLDAEEKMALWSLLPSDIRSAIKRGAPKPSLASQP